MAKDIFTSTVVPIMNKVRDDLSRKQAEEYGRHASSWGAMMAGAAGPDGGMAAMDAYNDTIYYIGEWNSKTAEDYIEMVKDELKKKGITVDAVMEKKMIDHLIEQQMPKSTAEYILRKADRGYTVLSSATCPNIRFTRPYQQRGRTTFQPFVDFRDYRQYSVMGIQCRYDRRLWRFLGTDCFGYWRGGQCQPCPRSAGKLSRQTKGTGKKRSCSCLQEKGDHP